MKAKKQTAGERVIVSSGYVADLRTLRTAKMLSQHRDAARRIDALVRRAAREAYWAGFDCGFSTEENANSFMMRCPFGSRLIKIDPNAPSFEPGPTEWVDMGGVEIAVLANKSAGELMIRTDRINGDTDTVFIPNTRTDIGHLIRALVTAWHAAKEGT